jgi:hypothetical protein
MENGSIVYMGLSASCHEIKHCKLLFVRRFLSFILSLTFILFFFGSYGIIGQSYQTDIYLIPRLSSEGSEGNLLESSSVGNKIKIFSHCLYVLKKDKDSYCIGLFPPQISASSYVLKLETPMPVGRGHSISHYFVCSMYQLGKSNVQHVRNVSSPIRKQTKLTKQKNRRQKKKCTFVIEAFEPDTSRECIPLLIDEDVLYNACKHSSNGVQIMEGGTSILVPCYLF